MASARARAIRLASLVALLALGCGGEPGTQPQIDAGATRAAGAAPRTASVGGRVVSTVDGEPITIDEVEDVVRETGLAPIDALHRLEEERALAARAELAPTDAEAEADRAARRAAVQALLAARVETEIELEDVPPELVERNFEAQRTRFQQPEKRRTTHVLARLPREAPPEAIAAAERFARRAIERLSAAADPVAEAHAIRDEGITGRSFQVVVEDLPPAGRGDPFEAPYLEATFALAGTGVTPSPVRTSYGFHAIVVSEIVPPWETPREEAEATIRDELLVLLRTRRLEQLVQELASRTPVTLDEAAITRFLATDLEGSGP